MESEHQTKEWLTAHGYGGLYVPGTCGCELSDLAPCGQMCESCAPGYKHSDPRPGHDGWWAIFGKQEAPDEGVWGYIDFC